MGFQSHDLEGFRIYGYYPEVEDNEISFFRRPVVQLNLRTKQDRWACYRFVENLDREFLPIHTDRLMYLLAMTRPSLDHDNMRDVFIDDWQERRAHIRKIRSGYWLLRRRKWH